MAPPTTFILGSLLTILEGLGYLLVGVLLVQKQLRGAERIARNLFISWWAAIGCNKMLGAFAGLGFAYGGFGIDGYASILYVNVVLLCLSLWCLLNYLQYLQAGGLLIRWWITALYAGYYLLLTYQIVAGHPIDVEIGPWRHAHVSEFDSPAWRSLLVLALLVLPQTIAAFAYLSLVRHVHEATIRYRILLVAISIVGWTTSILLVASPGFATSASMQVASRFIGLASAVLGLAAYRPARWIQKRFGIKPLMPVEPIAAAGEPPR